MIATKISEIAKQHRESWNAFKFYAIWISNHKVWETMNPNVRTANGAGVRIWQDQSFNNKDATTTFIASKPVYNDTRKALEFSGVSEDLMVSSDFDVPIGGNSAQFEIHCFLKWGAVNGGNIFSSWDTTLNVNKFWLERMGTGELQFRTNSDATPSPDFKFNTVGTMANNTSYYIRLVCDLTQPTNATRYKVYFNGVLQTLVFTTTTNKNIVTGNAQPTRIGAVKGSVNTILAMTGAIAMIGVCELMSEARASVLREKTVNEFKNL